MRALLLSTYELGHQPLHVAAPAGTLRRAGHEVRCLDLSRQALDPALVAWADAVAVSVPMHTAMRLARDVADTLRRARPELPLCFYGLYAAVDDGSEPTGRPDLAVAGEYEKALVAWFAAPRRAADAPVTLVERARAASSVPDRSLLPPLDRYAELVVAGEHRTAGYVEASRGCAHRCRHCPVPVVYDGRTRLVDLDTVLSDVGALVDLGARHVTFGDPDFLNGPHHARRVVSAVHGEFPAITFDVTAKVEHVLAHRSLWPQFAAAGCLFVVSAFESATDSILERLDKGHTVADEIEAVRVLRAAGIEPRPSLLPFTPWTSAEDVVDLLDLVAHCDLVGNVDPVQYSIRLLVPPGSLLLEGGHLQGLLGVYDDEHLGWRWEAPDSRLDELQRRLAELAEELVTDEVAAEDAYAAVRALSWEVLGASVAPRPAPSPDPSLRSALAPEHRPRLSEPWFCCAEPTAGQRATTRPTTLSTGGR